MIAVDTNILVYAHRAESDFFDAADRCMRELAEGSASWAIPWPCIHEFVAIVTNPKIFKTPTPMDLALKAISVWIASPAAKTLAESEGYFDILANVLRDSKVAGARVHDGRVAALCLHHGVSELWTADRDFSRFPLIRTRNPLSSAA